MNSGRFKLPDAVRRIDLASLRRLYQVPRTAFIVGIPVVAFLATMGFSLATSGNDSQNNAAPTIEVAVQKSQATSTPAAPVSTAIPIRTSCSEIQGTAYRSDAERDWYQANCGGGGTASAGGGAVTRSGTALGPGAVETSTGDRMVIARIGVNAPVSTMSVGGDGVMPDPKGYFNLVLYDFAAIPGLGGSFTSGNATLAGHVDCARCGPGGSPGLAVLYYMRNLVAGDVIEWYTQAGGYQKYVVTFAGDYQPNADWASIVASGAADMTIITCTGTFSGGEYNLRRVVQARKA